MGKKSEQGRMNFPQILSFRDRGKNGIGAFSGIGARVNLVFAAISAIMLGVMAISWMAFEELGGQISEINEVRVPSLSRTVNLFSIADDFLKLGPELAYAATDQARQGTHTRMTDLLDRLRKLNELQMADGDPGDHHQRIEGLLEHLHTSLTLLNSTAQYRLRLHESEQLQQDRLAQAYQAYQEAISAILPRADYPFFSASVLKMEREGRRFQDGLLVLPSLDQRETVLAHMAGIRTLAAQLQQEAAGMSAHMADATGQLVSLMEGENSLTAIRLNQIETERNIARALDKTRVRIVQLRLVLTLNMKSTEAAIAEASGDARKLIASRTAQLGLSVAVVVALSFLASLIFVRRSLVRRLTQLGEKMKRIAEGELDTEIDTGGNDEITRMAQALEVFRTTAREVEEQQTRAIIESSVAGLVMTNADGDIEFLSHTARKLFGYEPSAYELQPGLKISRFVLPEEGRQLEEMLATCRAQMGSGDPMAVAGNIREFNACRMDGRVFPSDIAVRGVSQRSGRKFIFTIYDVSERKQAQQMLEQTVQNRTRELRHSNEELERENQTRLATENALRSTKEELVQASKLAALGKMASGISHEFNQPLMAVASWLHNVEMLLEQGALSEADEALEKIGTQVNRMIELASHIQTLARQPAVSFASTDLKQVIGRALSLFQVRLHQEGAEVAELPGDRALIVPTDGLRLEQIFINLIANGLDATAGQDEKQLIFEADTGKDGQISIALSDNGPGIAAEIRDHLFDPFFTTKEVGKGMGLGLSISYNIARSLGGSLTVDNRKEGGARFTLTLPMDPDSAEIPLQAEEIW